MSRKQVPEQHLIKTNFYGIADKIKKAKKKSPTRRVSKNVQINRTA